jgi:predicted oxidoreductase
LTDEVQIARGEIMNDATPTAETGHARASRRTTIPGTELEISRLAMGTAMLGVTREAQLEASTHAVIEAALECGITFFDVADVYGGGRAEETLGRALARSSARDRVVVQTKCGSPTAEAAGPDLSGAHILRSVEGSLRRLATDRIDVLLLHWPDELVEPDEVAGAFDQLHAAGKVRHFGVSNHNPLQIETLARSLRQPLVANQIELGLAKWMASDDPTMARLTHGFSGVRTVDYCRSRGIQVQAYSPLRGRRFSAALAERDDSWLPAPQRALGRLLTEIGARYGVGPGVIMLAWLLRHPAGIVPVMGASSPSRVRENARADAIDLTRHEWNELLSFATELPPLHH